MRPAGAIRQALLQAAADLAHFQDGCAHGPTLQELAARAQVGARSALSTVKNMTRSGALSVVAERKVPYRNRPVAEYAPAVAPVKDEGYIDMASVFSMWAQG
jgi:hypothetical protein